MAKSDTLSAVWSGALTTILGAALGAATYHLARGGEFKHPAPKLVPVPVPQQQYLPPPPGAPPPPPENVSVIGELPHLQFDQDYSDAQAFARIQEMMERTGTVLDIDESVPLGGELM